MADVFSFDEARGGSSGSPPSPTPSTFSFDEAAQPSPTPSTSSHQTTGFAANVGAGLNDAFAQTLGAPVDAATGLLNLAGRGINSVMGSHLGQIENPVGGSESIKTAFGLFGADPRTIAPADDLERFGRAAGQGAGSMLLPWSVARALPVAAGMGGALQEAFGAGSAGTQAAAGAAGGAAGQYAADQVPEVYKPLANFGGQMLGGGAVFGAAAAGRSASEAGGRLLTAQALTKDAQSTLAGQRIAAAATDAGAVRQALAEPPAPLVPGSEATTFQLTADPGLGNLERAVAKGAPDAFNARAAAQNEARLSSLQTLAPADASPEAVGQAFRKQLSAIDGFGAAGVGSAETTARNAVGALGSEIPAGADQQSTALQAFGQRMRGSLVDTNAAAKANESRLWQAVDPDGTLTVNMLPVREGARELMRARPQNAAPLQGEPAAVMTLAQLLPRQQPFAELGALRSRITDAMRAEMQASGRSQTWGTLSGLLDKLHDTMSTTVEQAAARDAASVASGNMSPSATIMSRVQQAATQFRDGGGAGNPVGAGSVYSGGQAGGVPGVPREPIAGQRGSGGVSSDRGLAPAAADLGGSQSLLSFLVQRGGVRDEASELAGMDAGRRRVGLVRVNGGMKLDMAREAADEAGYLQPGSTTSDLLNAISDELHGRRVYRPDQAAEMQGAALSRQQSAREVDRRMGAREDIQNVLDDAGARLSPSARDHAEQLVMGGYHPHAAVLEAARSDEEQALQSNTDRAAFGRPGVNRAASQGGLGLADTAASDATFDAAAATRYGAAREATAQRHATFTRAPGVGEILKPGASASEFRIGASQVPSQIVVGGAGGAERARAYLQAGGDRNALSDYLTFDLRRAAEKDGVLDASKFAAWAKRNHEVLQLLPDLATKMRTAASASKAVDAAIATRAQATRAFESSAAARFLGDADPVVSMGRIIRSDTGAAQVRDLVRMTAGNQEARAGLQRAAIESMQRDLQGNTVLAGSEQGMLKADAFQTFMKQREATLAHLFSSDQLQAMRSIAADLQRSSRSNSGIRLQSGSNTAQDLHAGAVHSAAGHGSALNQIIAAEALGDLAHHVGGMLGKISGMVVVPVLSAMRQAGLRKVDDLVTEAMLRPEIAKMLLAKTPNAGSANFVGQSLARQVRGLAFKAAATSPQDQSAVVGRPQRTFATPATAPRVAAFR